jgi:1,4-dihydroxy-2-naphthoyl-CoA hydrolase
MLLYARKGRTLGRNPQLDLLDRVNETKLPFAELLGIEFVSASPERVVAEMTVREDLCTVPAVLHGGAIMALADTLGAMGTIVNLPQGAGTTTIESKTNFVAPAPVGTRVTGEATPIHRGRRTMIWQTRISTSEGRLVALVTQTQLVL